METVKEEAAVPRVDSLSSEQVAHFQNVFNLFDTDGGGSIDILELKLAVKHIGCNADEAESMFLTMDENSDGVVDFSEFLKVMAFSVQKSATNSTNGSSGAQGEGPNASSTASLRDMRGAVQAFRTFRVNSTREYRQEGDRSMYTSAALKKRKRIRSNPAVVGWLSRFWTKVTSSDESAITPGLKDEERTIHRETYTDFQVKMCKILFDEEDFDVREATEAAEEEWEREMGRELPKGRKATFMGKERFFESLFETIDVWTETCDLKEYVDTLGHVYQNLTYLWEGDDVGERGKMRTLEDIRSIHATKYNDKETGLAPPSYTAGPPAAREPPGTPSGRLAAIDVNDDQPSEEARSAVDEIVSELAEREKESIEGWAVDTDGNDIHRKTPANVTTYATTVSNSSSRIRMEIPFAHVVEKVPIMSVAPELGKRQPVPVLNREPDVPVRYLERTEKLAAARASVAAELNASGESIGSLAESAPTGNEAVQRAFLRAQKNGVPMPRLNMRCQIWGCADPRPLTTQLGDPAKRWRAPDEIATADPASSNVPGGDKSHNTNDDASTLRRHSDVLKSLLGTQINRGIGLAPMEQFYGLSGDAFSSKVSAPATHQGDDGSPPEVEDLLAWAANLPDSSAGSDDEQNSVEHIAARIEDTSISSHTARTPAAAPADDTALASATQADLEQVRHRITAAAYSLGGTNLSALCRQMDANHDGLLELGDFHRLVRRVLHLSWNELTGEQVDCVFALIDGNCSGTIGFDELADFLSAGSGWGGYESVEQWLSIAADDEQPDPSEVWPREAADEETQMSPPLSWISASGPPSLSNYSFAADADGVASLPTLSYHADFEASVGMLSKAGSLVSRCSGIKSVVEPELGIDQLSYDGESPSMCAHTVLSAREDWMRKCPPKDKYVYPPVEVVLKDAKAAAIVYDPRNRTNANFLVDDHQVSTHQTWHRIVPKQPSKRLQLSSRHLNSPRNGNGARIPGVKKVAVLSAYALPLQPPTRNSPVHKEVKFSV